ncbi:MAG: endolytic transglycosylase MltG [Pseudomonadales bacterium]
MSKLNRLLLISTLFITVALGANQWFQRYLDTPLQIKQKAYVLVVPRGANFTGVANQLEGEGLLRYHQLLVIYARLTEQTAIKSGEFSLPRSTTLRQLLPILLRGQAVQYAVTLIEGWRAVDALAALAENDVLQLTDLNPVLIAQQLELGETAFSLEGRLFPDTYFFERGVSTFDIVRRAKLQMDDVLSAEWSQRADELPYDNAYQALVMASIVEKETGVDAEREQIAGVFVARLRKGMRLQTDPTVIYAMGDQYQGNIRRKDLRIVSPYNTYRVSGLPPTPIALPGQRSIYAALHPLENGMLYFVARGDGSHQFSATLEEHQAAVRKFQRQRRADYRSTPQP